jgi:hypothetical protein
MLKTTAPTRIYLAFLTKKRVEGIYEYAAFNPPDICSSSSLFSYDSLSSLPFYRTNSTAKLSFLNNLVGLFEYEWDEDGNSSAKVWEWK